MNQRQALQTLVIDVREHEPEEKELLKALKWADKRLQTLLEREERRKVPIPADLHEEPLALSWDAFYEAAHSTLCSACSGRKSSSRLLCVRCYLAIPDAGVRKALWYRDHSYHGFIRALRLLKETRSPK